MNDCGMGKPTKTVADASLINAQSAEDQAALFRRIFEKSTAPSLIIEEDQTISMINEKIEDLVGYSKAEIEGK